MEEREWLVVATWPFSFRGAQACGALLNKTEASLLEAVVAGIEAVELDAGVRSVGYGGLPNRAGVLQQDACITDGRRFGAVMALEGYRGAIRVAHGVLQHSQHTALSGVGAVEFAQRVLGMAPEPAAHLLPPETAERYREYLRQSQAAGEHVSHDTVGMIAYRQGDGIVAGCSTSGAPFKDVGRVGDSPLPGGGAYCDPRVGAAVATGDGDYLMRVCPTFLAIEHMRQGECAQRACELAIERVRQLGTDLGIDCNGAVIAVSADGTDIGAHATHDGFTMTGWRRGEAEAWQRPVPVPEAHGKRWRHLCK
ncbi:hypothetical protein CDCA_CDCA16G4219 [Cyanidium caldarium]|uniref:Asparaginase n=1 Tax=Cyanidium caldarium TaxID=2771 RepID=A0AAV9J0Y1_CYACA|nr:hypothetical protein CDCA_CDCA16G4219 [Cyanidium caldarium]|eukprot:ctg_2402.g757